MGHWDGAIGGVRKKHESFLKLPSFASYNGQSDMKTLSILMYASWYASFSLDSEDGATPIYI
jgi:hypothetical protein